jgi:coenzyme F420-reducing hydrogenase beta subunit
MPSLKLSECTGCFVCEAVCPLKAIKLSYSNGFYKPVINEKICIECDSCVKHCHVTDSPILKYPIECFAAIAPDEVRSVSSSGGAFSQIALEFMNQGGVVCGASFDENFQVHHTIVDSEERIKELRGSKYMQSNLSGVHIKLKNALDEGKPVLFIGCPCQVAGIQKFLGSNKNFITVDLVCHGISSSVIFDKYLKDIHGNKSVSTLAFKSKKPWGWRPSLQIKFSDGTHYERFIEKDLFFKHYLSGLSMNPVCSMCPYAKQERTGDITIGDFWGIEKYDPSLNDGQGTSLVLANTKKGFDFFNLCIDKFCKVSKVPFEYAINGNSPLRRQVPRNQDGNRFLKELPLVSYPKLIQSITEKIYDVGILIPEVADFETNLSVIFLYQTIYRFGLTCTLVTDDEYFQSFRDEFNVNPVSQLEAGICRTLFMCVDVLGFNDYDYVRKYSNRFGDVHAFNLRNTDNIFLPHYEKDLKKKLSFICRWFYTIQGSSWGDQIKIDLYHHLENSSKLDSTGFFVFFKSNNEKKQDFVKRFINLDTTDIYSLDASDDCPEIILLKNELELLHALNKHEVVITDSIELIRFASENEKKSVYLTSIHDYNQYVENLIPENELQNIVFTDQDINWKFNPIVYTVKRQENNQGLKNVIDESIMHRYFDVNNNIGFGLNCSFYDYLMQLLPYDRERIRTYSKKLLNCGDVEAGAVLAFSETVNESNIEDLRRMIRAAAKKNPVWWKEYTRFNTINPS